MAKGILNGNTGTLLRAGGIIAVIAFAWANMSGGIKAVGEKVDGHFVATEKQTDTINGEIKALDKTVDANCLEIAKVKIRADAFEKAQEALADDVSELKTGLRMWGEEIIKTIKERNP